MCNFFAGPIGASVYEAGEPLLRAYPEAQSKVHSSDPAVRIPRVSVQVSPNQKIRMQIQYSLNHIPV
jgi:hypothetical protein